MKNLSASFIIFSCILLLFIFATFIVYQETSTSIARSGISDSTISSHLNLWLPVIIFGAVTVVFAVIEIVFIYCMIADRKAQAYFEMNAQTITAKVTGIEGGCTVIAVRNLGEFISTLVCMMRGNRDSIEAMARARGCPTNNPWRVTPWLITAEWVDPITNQRYVFKSDGIRFDPAPYVKDTIIIKIDANNPKHYWMDTSFLPNMT